MKYTLFPTQHCNLSCDYCYVGKTTDRMSLDMADQIVNFAFRNTPASEDIDIGFFGGEPLLEFPLLGEVTQRIETHPGYDPCRVKFSVVTNGTLLTTEIAQFLQQHHIALTISYDGPSAVHDKYRHFPGRGGNFEDSREWHSNSALRSRACSGERRYRPDTMKATL